MLRDQVVLMENPGLTISYPLVTFLTQLSSSLSPRALSHFTLAQKLWATGQNPEDCQKILWPILRKFGTLKEAALSWMEKELDMLSNFETIEVKPLPPGTSVQLAELIALTRAL